MSLARLLFEGGFVEWFGAYSNLERIENAAEALSAVVVMYAAERDPPLDPRYKSINESLELLKREPELHAMLKRAHADGSLESYDIVRSSIYIRQPRQPFPEKAQEVLDEIRPLVEGFIADTKSYTRVTAPRSADSASLAHMESLELMGRGREPFVILKDLGSFVDDPVLASRVENLFVRGKKTVLVNTSGSGKTRLTFEGLCHNWGFYFTFLSLMVQDLGSRDISVIVDELDHSIDGFSKEPASSAYAMKHNHSVAEEILCRVLLTRLLIFRMFLDITKEGGLAALPAAERKKKWLLLQLLPPTMHHFWDIFESLGRCLVGYDTRQDIPDVLDDIREHLGPDFHLFFVLDEGQAAVRKFPQAFHTVPGKLPFLVKILDTWDKHILPESFSCVIAGTDIPTRIFEDPKYADEVRWTSDTGSFDDQALHEHTQLGKEFLQRAWAWTRGRHRYTASLVMIMLKSNFQEPHNMLDCYIAAATKFRPTDGTKWTEPNRRGGFLKTIMHTHPFSWLYGFDVENTRSILQSIIFHYLAADRRLPPLEADMIDAVSLSFGRFVDGQMKEIACDEPIAITGVAAWMTRRPPADERIEGTDGSWNYLTALRTLSPPPTAKAFAACLAFYFSRAFDSKRKLCDIFTFPAPVPAWAKRPATLVELHTEAAAQVWYSMIPGDNIVAPLATSAISLDEVVSWMEHANRTPFCIPQAEASTFDLLFVLKLAHGAPFIWVIMRVDPTTSDGSDLFKSLDDTSLFCDAENNVDSALRKRAIELLNASPSQATTSRRTTPMVLRVVAAFNNQIVLEERTEDSSLAQASLCLDMFHQLTAAMPLSAFVETVVTNLLQRKHEATDDEEGERRGRKRQNLMPLESEEKRGTKKAKITKKTKSVTPRPTPPAPLPAPIPSHYNLRARPPNVPPIEEKRKKRGTKAK
ncbi:hypothetical protein B0H12DRAFT_1241679 [Mycena haematopus]|nr:hypothetical protein B0H12DRAFT_1241679 [Mycena haematopus]